MDGAKTEMDLFEDTFISIELEEGTHTIALRYFPKGFIPGVLVSVVCILLFAGLWLVSRAFMRSLASTKQ